MKIDLNSPVEVWRIDAPNTGFPSCELTLFNLSGQQVVSVEVTLTLLDPDGQEITRITHRAHGLTGAPMRTFSMTVPVEEPRTSAAAKRLSRRFGTITAASGAAAKSH